MQGEEQKLSEIEGFIRHSFGIAGQISRVETPEIEDLTSSLTPDLILDDGQRRYYIEVAPKSGLNKLSQLSLYRELLKAEGKYRAGDLFILFYKTISSRTEEVAEKVGIKTVRAPFDLKLSGFEKPATSGKVKLTAKRSWDVIYYLISRGPASMYQISKDTGVSYGWVHTVVTGLIDLGVASKEYDRVQITDIGKLLNGVAWERPFERMKIAETWVDYETAYSAAMGITSNMMTHGVKYAFAGTTAGGLYTGRVIRHDTVYLYLEKEHVESFVDTFSAAAGRGIKVKIYSPDRDVFDKSQMVQFVTVTSPGQTLLDLAGMGYGNLELTKAMAEYHEAK
jgi:hypothetical protein